MMHIDMSLDPKLMNSNIATVMNVLEHTDDLYCIRVCNMYIDLCKLLAENVVPDETAKIMDKLEAEKRDNMDRDNRHNVNPANRPSLIQEKYGAEEDHF